MFRILLSSLSLAAILVTCSGQQPGKSADVWFAGSGKPSKQESPYREGVPQGFPKQVDLGNPFGIEIQGDTIWITSVDDHCIYRGDIRGGQLTRVAGTGQSGYSGDGGPALSASFNWPHEVRADSTGNLYVADTRNHVIRRIDNKTRVVTTIAGDGVAGFLGDGRKGRAVRFKQPHSVVLDGDGGLLVADTVNHRLRKIDLKTGLVETICGTGEKELPKDGSQVSTSPLFGPRSLAVSDDSIWIALREGNSIWRINRRDQTIHHVAGSGDKGYTGDGGDPKFATFSGPKGLVIDELGRLLVVDTENQAIRRIDLKRKSIGTVMGENSDHYPIVLKRPHGIAFAPGVGFFVADSENHRVLLGQ